MLERNIYLLRYIVHLCMRPPRSPRHAAVALEKFVRLHHQPPPTVNKTKKQFKMMFWYISDGSGVQEAERADWRSNARAEASRCSH